MEQVLVFILRQMFNFSIPLLIVALGGMFSSRSGVTNIGLEGMMVFGALTSITFIRLTQGSIGGHQQLIIAILIAIVSGILISFLHALASINFKANQIISGQAINMFTPAFAIFVARVLFGEQLITFNNTFVVDAVPILSKIPFIGSILFSRIYVTTYLGIAIFVIAAFVLNKTKFGLRLRACGEFPQAPDAVGVNVLRMRYAGVLISGALSGLGGLIFVLPNSTQFNASVAGYGFLALAVMIFGQWTPSRILFASFFFGLMMTFSATYSGIPFLAELGVPGNYYKMLPYIVTMIVLLFSRNSSRAPKAEGQPFEKGMR
jgi:simple sugar transport system permease protein